MWSWLSQHIEHFSLGSIFSQELGGRDSLAPFPHAAVDKTDELQVTLCLCVGENGCVFKMWASTILLANDIRTHPGILRVFAEMMRPLYEYVCIEIVGECLYAA